MANLIERLEKLAEVASERPWVAGQGYGALVTRGRCANPTNGAGDREFYGGALIGESIGAIDRDFITAVVNTLPDLLKIARVAQATDIGCYRAVPVLSANRIDQEWDDCGACPSCNLHAVLEPLFREDGTPAPPKGHFAEVTMYVAVCDGCAERHDGDEHVAWVNKDQALIVAEESNWRVQDDGRLLCWDCRALRGGDLFEEEENPS